ncbi:DUF2934 domain-containing protein [Variovorax boronicumulans]|uniref:DUF2934 domain-containing protein n=1 Tax=Variovorax boronicumulans TaxID=436515 RepID=UPI002473E295|nr:DUF2934 domain-containing protein [Variovorax boronicumulans]
MKSHASQSPSSQARRVIPPSDKGQPTQAAPTMSPVNIDQNRAVGLDGPEEGSRMGREANKETGYPGEVETASEGGAQQSHEASKESGASSLADIAAGPVTTSSDAMSPATREDAIRHAAYEAYQRRGGMHGRDTDDWLEAERQLEGKQPRE